MKILNVDISEQDFAKYNLQSERVHFTELVEKIRADIAKETLRKAQQTAHKVGLSGMSADEINAEIAAIRDAKDNS